MILALLYRFKVGENLYPAGTERNFHVADVKILYRFNLFSTGTVLILIQMNPKELSKTLI